MERNEYSLAGWLSISAAVLALPALILSIAVDIMNAAGRAPVLLPVFLLVTIVQLAFAVYALGRFRSFLNERHAFHGVDFLIPLIIAGSILLTVVGIAGKMIAPAGRLHPVTILFIGLILVIGIPLSILSIVFALRLRNLESDLGGYKMPFVTLTIAASVCFATLILAPIGLLLDAAASVLLGLIFLKPESEITAPEFV